MPKAEIPKDKKSKTQVPKGRFNTKREGRFNRNVSEAQY